MANSIDEKVVQLTLDNKQFNKASDDTIDSLERLKQSLEFEGAIDSFDELERASKRVDFSPLERGVDSVGHSFTILDTITDTVFRNLTNRIIDSGERMIKSLSTDQITTGWEKYAEQTGAVQTIMAATAQQFNDTGKQMEVVNEQLEKLTWFTDETSHKFNDMVSGIGKFTANNIDLDTSVKAMEGIATWASLSGANANEASRAIYNLAQAISVGSVKLIDWKSIENANMGTTEFKNTVIQTAEEMGTLIKVADDLWTTLDGKGSVSSSNFTEDLQRGWFTSDVLLKSLDRYGNFADRLNAFTEATSEAGTLTTTLLNLVDDYVDGTLNMQQAMDVTGLSAEELTGWLEELGSEENELGRRAFKAAQETKTFQEAIDYVKEAVSSGWATSFKYIFGDYLEAKEWWSEIAEVMYDAFVVGGELRNTILSMWKDKGGRDKFLDGIREIIENTMDLVNIFKDAWNETWFGDDTNQIKNQATALLNLTKRFETFAKAIKPTEATAKNLKDIFSSLFSILKTGVDVLKAVWKGLSPIADILNVIAGSTLQFIANLTKGLSGNIQNFFNEQRLAAIASSLRLISAVISGVLQVGLAALFTILEKIISAVKSIFEQVHEAGGGIRGVITVLVDTVTDFFNAFIQGETVVNRVADGILFIFSGLAAGVKKIIDTIVGLITGELTFGDLFSGKGGVTDAIDGFNVVLDNLKIRDKLTQLIEWLKGFCADLIAADGIIVQFVTNITDAIAYLWDKLGAILDGIDIDDIKDLLLIAILWNFVSGLNKLNASFTSVTKSIAGTFTNFNDVINILTKTATPRLTALNNLFNKTQPLQIGIAITLLVSALGKLNSLDYNRTQQSVAALGVTLAMLVVAMKAFGKVMNAMPKKPAKDSKVLEEFIGNFAKNMLFMSTSVLMIAQALKTMNETMFNEEGTIDFGRIAAIFLGVGTIMAALTVATRFMKGIDGSAVANVASIIALSAGIRLIVESVRALDKIGDMASMYVACFGVSTILVALGAAVRLMSTIDWKTALATVPLVNAFTVAMISVAASVAVLATTIKIAGLDDAVAAFAALAIGFAEFGVALGLLGTFLKKTPAKTIISIGVAINSFASSMLVLAGALLLVSQVDIGKSWASIAALGAMFAGLAIALGVLGQALEGVKPDRIIAIGFSLMEMGGAVMILAGALMMINGIQWDAIADGVAVIIGFIIAFTALGALVAAADVTYFGMISQALINMSDAFLKFSLAIGVLSASILALSAASAIMATIVAAFQALAEKVGVDFPAMVEKGFDGLELILHEFLQMVVNLAPDMLAVFTVLFAMIAFAIIAVKEPTALAIASLILTLAEEIAAHGQEFVDALTTIINFINTSTELFQALQNLCYNIGHFIGYAIVEAIRGVMEGAAEGLCDIIGIEFKSDRNKKKIESAVTDTYEGAVRKLNNPMVTEAVKAETAGTINTMIQEWINGERELSDEMVTSGLQAMKAYGDAVGGETKKSVDVMLTQLAIGIKENRKDWTDTAGILGEYLTEGVGIGADPVEPFDFFRNIIGDEMYEMLKAGIEAYGGDWIALFASFGGENAQAYLDGFNDVFGDGPLARLVVGKQPEEKTRSKHSGSQRKMADLMGIDMSKEAEEIVEEAGENGFDVGNNWINNVGSGIKSGTKSGGGSGSTKSATEEAKTAAQLISEAFVDELDRINRETQVSDKLFELWKAQNPDAKELELSAKEIEYQSEKVALATQKASVSQEIYQQTLEAMGESAKETHEAYIQMLDDQIAMLEAQNKLTGLQDKKLTDSSVDFVEWSRTMTQYVNQVGEDGRTMNQFLMDLGAAPEKIFSIVSGSAGMAIPEQMAEVTEGIKSAAAAGAIDVIDNYVSTTTAAVANAEPVLDAATEELTGYVSDSLETHTEEMKSAIEDVSKSVVTVYVDYIEDAADGAQPQVETAANKMSDTFVDTLADSTNNHLAGKTEEMSATIGDNLDTWVAEGASNFEGIKSKDAMEDVSETLTNDLGNGFVENSDILVDAATEMMDPTMAYLNGENVENWNAAGIASDNGMESGILDKQAFEAVVNAGVKLATDTLKGVTDFLEIFDGPSEKFKEVGLMIDEGLKSGIEEGQSGVIDAAVETAVAAYEAAKKKLDINSPSRVMEEVGRYFDLGFAKGIDDYSSAVVSSVSGMTESLRDVADDELVRNTAIKSLSDLLDIDESELHMTMIVDADTTLVDEKVSALEKAYLNANSIANRSDGMYGAGAMSDVAVNRLVNAINSAEAYRDTRLQSMYDLVADIGERTMSAEPAGQPTTSEPTTVNFTQNNYSPKAISRVETYRDTQRQLDTFSRKFGSNK